MLGRYFVDRPIFAWVIAIVIVLMGVFSLTRLPIAQYPSVAPPRVFAYAYYPGASAETLENSVTQVLEQQLKGIDGLLYFDSSSSSNGYSEISITLRQGIDPDTAQIQVQNKLQQALTRLPQAVQQQGLYVTKAQPDFLMVVALWDETDRLSDADIADFLVSSLQDPISRVDGIGYINIFGAPYAMRVWLDPYKLADFKLMPSDVDAAIKAQNTQVPLGEIGAQPALPGQQLNATVTTQSRLQHAEEFCAIILKTEPDGSRVRLCDVARVELGSESYSEVIRLDRHPASGMALTLAPGADALSTARAVKARVDELSKRFPAGLKVRYPRDATEFVERSIHEVWKTLLEAVALVVIVMYLFLQSWRATLIPAVAVPVVLLGTLAVLALFGYSINTLTLFGMVLSIGLLVDDAIVVVENVERLMREQGLSPRDATIQSIGEISGALIGISLVLSAVFLPMAFFGGSTGVIYRQFSITIVSSMLISVLVALTLSPALCASLLKASHAHDQEHAHGLGAWFNRSFGRLQHGYARSVSAAVARPVRFVVLYAAIAAGLYALLLRLPTGFLPLEDQGQAIVQFTLPVGATQQRSLAVAKAVEDHFLTHEQANVSGLFTVAGFSFAGSGQNAGMGFVQLNPWEARIGPENDAAAITERATAALTKVRDAEIFAITPPSIQGLGQTNGFTFQLLDTSGMGRVQLKAARDRLLELAEHDHRLSTVRFNGLEDTPQLRVDIDHAKLGALGLSQTDVNNTLSAAWGGSYVNDFIDRGRVKRVYQQGDAPFRSSPEDLGKWYVRSASGVMTPFSAFASTRWVKGPQMLLRFNGLPSFEIQGQAAPGESSGTAMRAMEELTDRLPESVGSAWSSLSYQERLSSGQAPSLYAISILVVFLCLAALYESWSIPISVLLVIPLGVVGAVLAASLRGLQNDVFFQVGLITTIGLSAKNAILIVEFAETAERRGESPTRAALAAAKLRLRPILMTSLAFVAGVIPLALATGAGARSRVAIGTGVLGGMLSATVLATLFIPMFFVLVRRLFSRAARDADRADAVGASSGSGANMSIRSTRRSCPSAGRSVRARVWLVPLALWFCHCSFEPHYERPTAPIPARWARVKSGAAVGGARVQPRAVAWQKLFLDPHLQSVVQKALLHNRDLRVATASILTARAQYALARANVLPRVALGADAYVRGNLAGKVAQQYALQVGTSDFELDVFGRLRSLSHAALETYLASQAGARAVRLSLIAETASAWLEVAAQRSLLAIAEQTEINAGESVKVTQSRFSGGVASELDVRQSETVLAQARSDMASYSTTLAQARNALVLLMGSEIDPADLPGELALANDTGLLREIPAGLESSVLLSRPDVLEAEHNLRAAHANIGAARAAFFPRISLTALGGLVSTALSALISTSAAGGTFAPAASLPIFTGGANEARLAYARAQRQLYVANYERVIQRAFREVADALARRGTIDAQLAAQQALLAASTASYNLSDARYRAGADSYLNALDAQRTLYTARRTLVLTQLSRADNLITLYRVLGGS